MAKAGNVESLAMQINRLLKDGKLRKKLAGNAYNKSKEFDVGRITKQFIEMYNSIA